MIIETTFSQMAFLFLLIAIGYILAKFKLVPDSTEGALSKLENYVFIPALVMGTFMNNFTIDKIASAKDVLIGSILIEVVVICVSLGVVRLCTKDKYIQNIYLYGLCFSNFGFMGNAIVSALFPEIFLEYLLFTVVLWAGIYIWGAPALLIGDNSGKKLFSAQRLKAFVNPMFIGMIIGAVIGLSGVKVPAFADNLVTSLGNCMSPVAMLLSGMTVARKDLVSILKIKSIYVISVIRLIVYPLLFILAMQLIPMSKTVMICGLCSIAMPLGLNTIVIPAAYGKDTSVAAGMALVSHILSCITIPLILLLANI